MLPVWVSEKSLFIAIKTGPQHSGRDGDGWDGPGDQHERNHHTGGCPEQDGEVWGESDPLVHCMYIPELLCTVCRHACMLHPACFSPATLWMFLTCSWMFVLFPSASSIAAALLLTKVLNISSPLSLSIVTGILWKLNCIIVKWIFDPLITLLPCYIQPCRLETYSIQFFQRRIWILKYCSFWSKCFCNMHKPVP